MEDRKFTNIKELLDFVLTECGGMTYRAFGESGISQTLQMTSKNIIFDYILFAYQLLQTNFNTDFIKLDISHLDLDEIPKDFLKKLDKLEILDCSDNILTELPDLPNSLELLNCSKNKLIELPKLPNSLNHLYCFDNELEELPKLPNSLNSLHCYDNPGYFKWKKDRKYRKFDIYTWV